MEISEVSESLIGNSSMDSEENGGFDMEAQESFLERRLQAEAETAINVNARKVFFKIILLNRSTKLFKLAAAGVIRSSSSSDYGVIGSRDQEHVLIQGSGDEDVAVAEIPMEIFNDSPMADNSEQNSLLQSKNINDIVRKKKVNELHRYGGVRGIAEALNTDLDNGKSVVRAEISEPKGGQICQFLVTFLHSFLVACNNYTVFLLFIAAVLSLLFGIDEEGLTDGWTDGVVILIIILALIIFPTMLGFWRERMSGNKLGNCWEFKGRVMKVQVVRMGRPIFVPQAALQVGDIAVLRKGDQVPADGIFVAGQALELDDGLMKSAIIDESNPFILHPSRVINGEARMIVTATGMDTGWGELLSPAVQSPDKKCKFEACLHKVNACINVTGLLISILIIVALFLRYKAGKLDDENGYRPDPKGEPTRAKTILEAIKRVVNGRKGTVRALTALLGVSLLGIVEGMPFVISFAIFVLNCRVLGHKATVRDYLACVKMASVTTICSDKFGGLTEDKFFVDTFFVGGELVCESSVVASNVLEGLCDGIRTLFLVRGGGGGRGQKLDQLFSWAKAKLGMKEGSEQCSIVSDECCDPFQHCCQVVMEKGEYQGQSKYCFYSGPPQHVLWLCSHYYGIEGEIQELDGDKRKTFDKTIEHMLAGGAEMIAYAREGFNGCDVWPVQTNGIIFMGMIGLKDTRREDTRAAISTLTKNGIRTVIASGDDVEVLRTIGKTGAIPDPDESDGLVLTAKEFKDWPDKEKMDKVEKICIMGNCLPSDKILLINYLREKGHTVALVAQQTIDAPALVQADIGLTFGTWSSEIAQECCDISIWDGCCFGVAVKAAEIGRCFLQNVRKFIQLQLIVTISSSTINFTATVALGDAPMTAVQLIWLDLVVPVIGGLALLTGPPTETLTTIPAQKLITNAMWRNIAIQALYQTTVFVALQHRGKVILGIRGDHVKSMIYNGFFLCQAFNKFIAREPERKNIFHGLFQKRLRWFWVALFVMLACQAAFAAVEKAVGCRPGLNLKLWGVCLFLGFVSWLLDWLGKNVIKCN